MQLSAADDQRLQKFRDAFEARFAGDARFRRVLRQDREDRSTLLSHFEVADQLWMELMIRPFVPQLRAGVVTTDRWRNEDLEERIEESGDTMEEFVEMGFEEAGLEWIEPPVQHRREDGTRFCFATALDLSSPAELETPAVFDKIVRMFEGYYHAFRRSLERAAAESANSA